jgi:hypothetical protein
MDAEQAGRSADVSAGRDRATLTIRGFTFSMSEASRGALDAGAASSVFSMRATIASTLSMNEPPSPAESDSYARQRLRTRRSASGSFAKKSVELTWEEASSASAFGLLTTPGNERSDQLDAGRSFVRAQLSATSSGIQSQPHFQLLEEYAAMAPLAARFRRAFAPSGRTVQMLFRLGYAEATVHSPRRSLTVLLVRAPAEPRAPPAAAHTPTLDRADAVCSTGSPACSAPRAARR